MNMIASLKALLFTATPLGAGKGAPALTPDGAPDFSAMMNAATVAPVGMPATAPDVSDHAPLPDAPATDAPVPTDGEALPLPTTTASLTPTQSAPIAAAPKPLTQSPLPITPPQAQPAAEPAEEAEPARSAEQPQPTSPRPDNPPTAIGSVAELLAASHIVPVEVAVSAPPPAPALPVESDPKHGKPASKAQHHATPVQVASSPVAPAVPSDTVPATDPEPASSDAEPERPEQSALAPPSPAMVMTPPAAPLPAASEEPSPDAPRVASPATVQTAAVPVAMGQPAATVQQSFAETDLNQAAPPTAQPTNITAAPAPVASPPAQAATVAPDYQPLGTAAIATPAAPATPIAQPAQPEAAPDPAPIATPVIMSSSVSAKAEALSLLQFARQHMTRHPAAAPVAESSTAPTDAVLAPTTDAIIKTAEPVAPAPVASTLTAQTAAPALPTVDLSATLGAQVVDMGVSGQWIDGLARDIAGLSANGAQGRFQISSDQLGPIEVNIRQGVDGTAVSLTVASDMAEAALRQDSDRLRLDAGLSAVRISEVKIERAPQSSDAGRSDQLPQQQSGQQNSQSANWQGAGPGMGQSQQQGRWQPRENIALAHKAGDDPAVLNHEQTGDTASQAIRARYA